MIKRIDCVIGANYGDEGKGWATYNIVEDKIIREDDGLYPIQTIVNVLHNGGSQRGHTVIVPPDAFPGDKYQTFHHVFHCFGSSVMNQIMRYNFAGEEGYEREYNDSIFVTVTYYDKDFLFNPVAIMNEYFILKKECENAGLEMPKIHLYAHPDCRVIFPQDILINRAIERKRAKNESNHGSCGLGIWECIARNNNPSCRFVVNDLFSNYTGFKKRFMSNKALDYPDLDYWESLLTQYGLTPEDVYKDENGVRYPLWDDFTRAWEDLRYGDEIDFTVNDFLLHANESKDNIYNIIFECGQGLALDQSLYDEKTNPHTTPSYTGLSGINYSSLFENKKNIYTLPDDIHIWYCTRPYLTRHGAGPLHSYINDLGFSEHEYTNPKNEFQGKIRYGPIILGEFADRILKDLEKGYFLKYCHTNYNFYNVNIIVNFINTTSQQVYVDNQLEAMSLSNFQECVRYKLSSFSINTMIKHTTSNSLGVYSVW